MLFGTHIHEQRFFTTMKIIAISESQAFGKSTKTTPKWEGVFRAFFHFSEPVSNGGHYPFEPPHYPLEPPQKAVVMGLFECRFQTSLIDF